MKKLVIKIALFLIVFVLIRISILLFVPYHWGNPWYSSKIQYLEKTQLKPNTIFFGSSRIYRQIKFIRLILAHRQHFVRNRTTYTIIF